MNPATIAYTPHAIANISHHSEAMWRDSEPFAFCGHGNSAVLGFLGVARTPGGSSSGSGSGQKSDL